MYKYRQIIDIAENTFRVRYMDKKRKKGFTLTELIVVLVIIAIIAAVAVPFFINYWKKAEFRRTRRMRRRYIWRQNPGLPITDPRGDGKHFKRK